MKGLIVILHLTILLPKELSYYGTKTRVKFSGSCVKQGKATNNHGTIRITILAVIQH